MIKNKLLIIVALVVIHISLSASITNAQTRPGAQPNPPGNTTPGQQVSRPGERPEQACRRLLSCQGNDTLANGKCRKADGSEYDPSQKVDVNPCLLGLQPSSDDPATCKCVSNASTVKRTPNCTGESCSKGTGQRCYLDSGKPVPDGQTPPNDSVGVLTAIGCVPSEPRTLVNNILRYGTFAAGGIAFLLMILAALQMITAEGNPNVIKTSQEKFYSAIIGLLLIIFSVLLMQVIGVDLLGLRGFGR